MKQLVVVFVLTMLSATSITSFAADDNVAAKKTTAFKMHMLEGAAEVLKLDMTLSGDKKGYVYAKECDHCVSHRLQLDDKTRLQIYSRTTRERSATDISNLKSFMGEPATILYNPDTLRITRIVVSI